MTHVQNLGTRLRMYVSRASKKLLQGKQGWYFRCFGLARTRLWSEIVRVRKERLSAQPSSIRSFPFKQLNDGEIANRISSKNNRAVWKERLTERNDLRRRRFPRRPFTACTRETFPRIEARVDRSVVLRRVASLARLLFRQGVTTQSSLTKRGAINANFPNRLLFNEI